jgi:hypothetical protein
MFMTIQTDTSGQNITLRCHIPFRRNTRVRGYGAIGMQGSIRRYISIHMQIPRHNYIRRFMPYIAIRLDSHARSGKAQN